MFHSGSQTFHSHCPEYPTPRELVKAMVEQLVASSRWEWVTFETDSPASFRLSGNGRRSFVEVACEDKNQLVINAAYSFKQDYQTLLAQRNIIIPQGWQVSAFKTRGWWSAGTFMLTTRADVIHRIAIFVDELFTLLYDQPSDYQLSGTLQ